jgi:hypothetical protein
LDGHTLKRTALQEALCDQDAGNTHASIVVPGCDGGVPRGCRKVVPSHGGRGQGTVEVT